jgi:hypothetical protein
MYTTVVATAAATAAAAGGECANTAITEIDALLGKIVNTNVATLVDIPAIATVSKEFVASTEGLPDTIVLMLEGLATTCGVMFVKNNYDGIITLFTNLYAKLNALSKVVGVAACLYVLGAMTDLVLKLGKEFVNATQHGVKNKYDELTGLSTEIRAYSTTGIGSGDIRGQYTVFMNRFATIMGFGAIASGGKRKSQKKQKKQKQQQKSQKKQHKKLSKSNRAKKAKQSKKANKKH